MTHQELPSYDTPPAGALRFNTDSRKLEVYCGGPVGFGTTTITGAWFQIDSFTPEIATGGTRGIFSGGYSAPPSAALIAQQDYITIDTTGNAQNFGDLATARGFHSASSSRTRGIVAGGVGPGALSSIELMTIASTGSVASFGNLINTSDYGSGLSNGTRGVHNRGSDSVTIECLTIASTGTAEDFGDLTDARTENSSVQSSTRGVFIGGRTSTPTPALLDVMDFITISTLGNAADFGNLSVLKEQGGGSSNSIRGLYAGKEAPAVSNVIEYITIATQGDSIDFGDLTVARNQLCGVASRTRCCWGGGIANPSYKNEIDYVQIMSTGNAVDFGDLQQGKRRLPPQGISNGHGGL